VENNHFNVIYGDKFHKSIRRLGHTEAARITKWIVKNLKNTTNPRSHGKALTGGLSGYWRYRVGKYRIIAEIRDFELILLLIDVGKREDIYRQT
jgi:mRNA interferase RelE/StbE